MAKTFEGWITKRALTTGIEKHVLKECDGYPDVVSRDRKVYPMYYRGGEGKDWHRTEASAVARADQMRLARIKSLEKQIEKLKKLFFEEKKQ